MDYSELTKDYLDDANGHLQAFDGVLLCLEKHGFDRAIVLNALGSLHTLKGNTGMMGFDSLKRYIHRTEELLKRMLEDGGALGPALDLLFETANVIRGALKAIEKDPEASPDLAPHIAALEKEAGDVEAAYREREIDLSSYLGTKTDTIRVDFKRLDDLLNLVGELVIFRTRLNQIGTEMKDSLSGIPLAKEMKDGIELMGKTISALQEGIMKARMLPVRTVFDKFPRMVRDLAKAQGKEIRLRFEGEDTELDKTVIDELEEPLMHIIRNAVDHGIERQDERAAKGKDHAGVITLSACQESSYVIIKVTDDGKGIDLEKVRERALEKGLIKPDEPFDHERAVSCILSAGFSTRDEVTEVSGRGVGLDIVNRNIAGLNGSVSVESLRGKGATVTMKVPLSLAIIPALMAEVGDEVYAIPMTSVDESVKVFEDDIHVINSREVVRFREQVLPVVRLNTFFGLRRRNGKRFYLVIISKAEKKIALAVDRLRGRQEIVIKPLDDTFARSRGIAGASILGDGRIVLIVDVMSFYEKKEVVESV